MVWSLEDNPIEERELKIFKYVRKMSSNAEFAHTVSRFVNLNDYLHKQNYNNPEELRKDVLSEGRPLFSPSESKQLFRMIAKTGGATEDVLDEAIGGWLKWLYEWSPGFIKTGTDVVSPLLFIAKTLEAGPFGPMLSIAMDSTAAVLPATAATIESIVPKVMEFIPIPESGPIGEIIGWMIASVFVILAMLLNISRQHFGQAFIVSFLLIPFFGTTMYSGALSAEKLAGKISTRFTEQRDKLLAVVTKIQTMGTQAAETLRANLPPIEDVTPPTGSGKGLSSQIHSKSKWRTQRRSRM
jgi:hypothetical protein